MYLLTVFASQKSVLEKTLGLKLFLKEKLKIFLLKIASIRRKSPSCTPFAVGKIVSKYIKWELHPI
jgi:hypothetical protein